MYECYNQGQRVAFASNINDSKSYYRLKFSAKKLLKKTEGSYNNKSLGRLKLQKKNYKLLKDVIP